jgi:large conductance mechanosensitive channel
MMKEFKEFAVKGNVVDMAVGIIIGAAFGKIVSSLVADVIMPPVGMMLGGMDFKSLFLVLGDGQFATIEAAKEAGVATLNYGIFLATVLDFLIIAFSIFMMVKAINRLKRKQAAAPAPVAAAEPTEKDCPFCLSKIPIKATRCGHCTSQVEVK